MVGWWVGRRQEVLMAAKKYENIFIGEVEVDKRACRTRDE